MGIPLLQGILPQSRNVRSFIVLTGLLMLLMRVCDRMELPVWCGWVAAAVIGMFYHTSFMQADLVGRKAAKMGKDLEFIQGDPAAVGGGSICLILIFSTRGLPQALEKMEDLFQSWGAGVQFTAISQEDKEKVEGVVKARGLTFPVAVDPSMDGDGTCGKYPVARLPTVFLCRSDGVIGWHGHPLDAELENALAKAVRADQRKKLADANKPKPGKVLSGKKAKSLRHRA